MSQKPRQFATPRARRLFSLLLTVFLFTLGTCVAQRAHGAGSAATPKHPAGFTTNLHQNLRRSSGKLSIVPYPDGVLRVTTQLPNVKYVPESSVIAEPVAGLRGTSSKAPLTDSYAGAAAEWNVDVRDDRYDVHYTTGNEKQSPGSMGFVDLRFKRAIGSLSYRVQNSSELMQMALGWGPKSDVCEGSILIPTATTSCVFSAHSHGSTKTTALQNGVTKIRGPLFFLMYHRKISFGLVLLNAAENGGDLEVEHNPQKSRNEGRGPQAIRIEWRFYEGDHDYFFLPGPTPKDVLRQHAMLFGRPAIVPLSILSTVQVIDSRSSARQKGSRNGPRFPFSRFEHFVRSYPEIASSENFNDQAFLADSSRRQTRLPDLLSSGGKTAFATEVRKRHEPSWDEGQLHRWRVPMLVEIGDEAAGQPPLQHTTPSGAKRWSRELSQQIDTLAITALNESPSLVADFFFLTTRPTHGTHRVGGVLVERNASSALLQKLSEVSSTDLQRENTEREIVSALNWKILEGMTTSLLASAAVGNPLVGVVAAGLPVIPRDATHQPKSAAAESDSAALRRFAPLVRLLQHLSIHPIAVIRNERLAELHYSGPDESTLVHGQLPRAVQRAINEALDNRVRLSMYIYTVSVHAHVTGVPLIVTPMWIEFYHDAYWTHRHQTFMLGDAIATRPIVEDTPIQVLVGKPSVTQIWYVLETGRPLPENTVEFMMGGDIHDQHFLVRGGAILPLVGSPGDHRSPRDVQMAALDLVVAPDKLCSFTASGAVYIDDGSGSSANTMDHGKHWYYSMTFARNRLLLRRVDLHADGIQSFRSPSPFSDAEAKLHPRSKQLVAGHNGNGASPFAQRTFPPLTDAARGTLNRGVARISIFGFDRQYAARLRKIIVKRLGCPSATVESHRTATDVEKVITDIDFDVSFGVLRVRDPISSLEGCDWQVELKLR